MYKEFGYMLMASDSSELFLRMTTSLFLAHQSVADLFFKNHLSEDIQTAIDRHVRCKIGPSKESYREYIRSLKDLDTDLQEISYLGFGDPVFVAIAREHVLSCHRAVLVDMKNLKKETPAAVPVRKEKPKEVISFVKLSESKDSAMNPTQQKIFEFVKRVPECRPKDIIGEFSALSQRTVKRSLKELSANGLIVKKIEGDGAVYYTAVSPLS